MELFQLRSSSYATAATRLGLDPRGLFLREGCWAAIHCPFVSLLLRSPLQRVTVPLNPLEQTTPG